MSTNVLAAGWTGPITRLELNLDNAGADKKVQELTNIQHVHNGCAIVRDSRFPCIDPQVQ